MAYSIYFYLKAEALLLIDAAPNRHILAFLKECFKYDYQRKPDNDNLLFSWVKPRGKDELETQLFDALRFLYQYKLVDSIVADFWNSESPIIEKLKRYWHTELIPISKDDWTLYKYVERDVLRSGNRR